MISYGVLYTATSWLGHRSRRIGAVLARFKQHTSPASSTFSSTIIDHLVAQLAALTEKSTLCTVWDSYLCLFVALPMPTRMTCILPVND